jgi:hypothetical protein
MRGCRQNHCGVSDRQGTADESAQNVNQKLVVCIQLNDVSIVSVVRRVREGWNNLYSRRGQQKTHLDISP